MSRNPCEHRRLGALDLAIASSTGNSLPSARIPASSIRRPRIGPHRSPTAEQRVAVTLQRGRYHQVGQLLADGCPGGLAEDPLGCGVELENPALVVDGDHAVQRRIEHRALRPAVANGVTARSRVMNSPTRIPSASARATSSPFCELIRDARTGVHPRVPRRPSRGRRSPAVRRRARAAKTAGRLARHRPRGHRRGDLGTGRIAPSLTSTPSARHEPTRRRSPSGAAAHR